METPMQIPATGRQVMITVSRVAAGKVAQDWHQGDILA